MLEIDGTIEEYEIKLQSVQSVSPLSHSTHELEAIKCVADRDVSLPKDSHFICSFSSIADVNG